MTITAKALGEKLGLSATAVSMALKNRPGVSTETRQRVLEAAEKYGYDFSKCSIKQTNNNDIYFIAYKAYNTVLNYEGIIFELYQGVGEECKKNQYHLKMLHLDGHKDEINRMLEDLRVLPMAGLILLGTTLPMDVCVKFLSLGIPMILLDSYIDNIDCSSVVINNHQGAHIATEYLIQKRGTQPGYIGSSLYLNNFADRKAGFQSAIRENGLSPANSIIHEVSPSIEGAFTDMLEIIEEGSTLANCYFAANDVIAIGVIKALTLRGIKVPEDVGIIGFDNIGICNVIQPALSSIAIQKQIMGQIAARQLIYQIQEDNLHPIKIEVPTKLIKRFSV